MAHIRQSRPDSGLGFVGKALKTFCVASSLGRGCALDADQVGVLPAQHVMADEEVQRVPLEGADSRIEDQSSISQSRVSITA